MVDTIYGVTVVAYRKCGEIVHTFMLDNYSAAMRGALLIADEYIKSHGLHKVFTINKRDDEYYVALDLLNDDGSIAYTFVTTRKELK